MSVVIKTFSAADTTSDVIDVNGPATVCIEGNPSGSTVDLETSVDGGTTWAQHYEDGVLIQFTSRTKYRFPSDGPMKLRLKVAAGKYGGTPFRAWISSSSGTIPS